MSGPSSANPSTKSAQAKPTNIVPSRKAGPIIAGAQDRIQSGAGHPEKTQSRLQAEALAEAYRSRQSSRSGFRAGVRPDRRDRLRPTTAWPFVGGLRRQVSEAGYDSYAGLWRFPGGQVQLPALDAITGRATPFLKYLDDWRPHAGLVPRCLDQAIATLKQFSGAVRQPIEASGGETRPGVGRRPDKPGWRRWHLCQDVNRKLTELRNYWHYLQSLSVVPEDRLPFDHRRVKDPLTAGRRRKIAGSDFSRRISCGYGTRPNSAVTSICRMPSGLPLTAERVLKDHAS